MGSLLSHIPTPDDWILSHSSCEGDVFLSWRVEGKCIMDCFNAADFLQAKVTCHPTRAKVKQVCWQADRRTERTESHREEGSISFWTVKQMSDMKRSCLFIHSTNSGGHLPGTRRCTRGRAIDSIREQPHPQRSQLDEKTRTCTALW